MLLMGVLDLICIGNGNEADKKTHITVDLNNEEMVNLMGWCRLQRSQVSSLKLRREAVHMETFEAIRTVLAVRQFKDTPIPDPIVRQIVEAGRLTASASNSQPWYFIVVRDKQTLRQLGQLARTGPYIAGAPLAIVVAMDQSPLAISDGSRAIQDMLLAAWS